MEKEFGRAAFRQSVDQRLTKLVEVLTPRISPAEASALLAVLKAAQVHPPDDTQSFVEQVNRLLDLFRIRIGTGDGEVYRLKFIPRASRLGYIYLLDPRGVNFNTFYGSTLRIVDVSGRFRGNRFSNKTGHVQSPTLCER